MTFRRLLCLLCLAACGTALVGCGSDTLSLDPVANAASKTASTESSRVAFAMTVTSSTVGTVTMRGRGIFDGRSKTGWMNATVNVPAQARAQVGANPKMEMIFDGSDGMVMYMRSSMLPGVPANSWVKMDLEKLAKQQGVDLGSLMNANQADPNQTLKMLVASSGARVSGSEYVRGVHTTRYSFRVDLDRLAKTNKDLREALDQLIQVAGVDAFPAEAWIDAKGRIRRLKIGMTMHTSQANGTITMVEEFYDFGVRATIFPPPDDQVIDLSDLIGG